MGPVGDFLDWGHLSREDWVLRNSRPKRPPGPEEKHVVFYNSQQELEDREELSVLVRSLNNVTSTTKILEVQEACLTIGISLEFQEASHCIYFSESGS